jgi:hypothetical protein
MAQKKTRKTPPHEDVSDEQDPGISWVKLLVYIAILVAIAIAAHLLLSRDRTPQRKSAEEPSTSPETSAAVAETESDSSPADDSAGATVDFDKLQGRWMRTDAGYQIDIKQVKADGSLQAAYYNPSPIRVAEAKASQEAGAAKVFIELRDVGYPGCTYDLTYDAQQDCLRGIYFQAAQQQEYPVEFVRQQR